ncbi:MAG TPA: protein tyrosine phosphatase [Hyphomicrobiaceae bacterium]|jgi:predicted protein tyrosine phosphatase|nr:protein tyrosine phosphatase [Hyphomicrobiaceae bacterium]
MSRPLSLQQNDIAPSLVMNGRVHVCPLSAVPHVVAGARASHLLTCLEESILVETPTPIEPERHLRLSLNDISQPVPGYVAPNARHVADLIDFALGWGGRGTAVIHCWAGISRSTAAAFVTLCTLNPEVPEYTVARLLREASPTAYPNRLIVRLADAALGRAGRMMAAVESIGRGLVASEAHPFSLPADLSALRRA